MLWSDRIKPQTVTEETSVIMELSWCCVMVSILIVASSVNADVKTDCQAGHMTLVWMDSRSQADTSLFRLGSCTPTSFTLRDVFFSVDLNDCNFNRIVTGSELNYTNELIYPSFPGSQVHPFTIPVVCSYERPKDWYPMIYQPVFSTYDVENLVFHFGIMNDDFTGPAESTSFHLGSMIPIMASVEQWSHQPLLVLLEECVASTTPAMWPGNNVYPIISNKGCLVESKTSRSKFEPRERSSEIRLSLQAFRFALEQEVYIHCNIVAWDPHGLDNTKKACHYNKNYGWELLDDPASSNLCACCDTNCGSRKRRSLEPEKAGLTQQAVIGPLTITELESSELGL